MNTLETLHAARKLISDPAKWTQGGLARDKHGEICFGNVPRACQWCAIGALSKVARDMTALRDARLLLNQVALQLYPDVEGSMNLAIAAVNDEIGHEAVLRVYDAAIESFDEPKRSPAPVIPLRRQQHAHA